MNLKISNLRRRPALYVTLAAVFACAFGPTALAQASPTVSLSTTGDGAQWAVTGTGFHSGESDISLWIQNVPAWTTLEYRANIATSSLSCYKVINTIHCNLGGAFTAQGVTTNTFIGPYPTHPLNCASKYEAVAYEPGIGYVYSSVLSMPACPVFT